MRETATELVKRLAFHGGLDALTLRSKPIKPDSAISGDGVFWWNGKHGFNAFGALVFYREQEAVSFKDHVAALLKAKGAGDE